ncbi:MAG TPA: glycosyltransferase family 2 protein [Gemmatimonadaceae bacterium]|nr:glycosyltransferase family 2 protein [Gemmatimonadaceae bacterium]
MLYIAIPAYNEAPTIGVLLWRIRKVFQEFSREYEIVVYNDGSTDATAETLQPYGEVLPLTMIGGGEHRGYAAAVDALCRHVVKRSRYARRDAMVLMQGDFTDQPENIPELVRRFEGGADLVVAEWAEPVPPAAPRFPPDEDDVSAAAQPPALPLPVRRLRRVAPWILRPFLRVPGVLDPFGSFRLFRLSLLRELVKSTGDAPLVAGEGWAANVDLISRTAPIARRVDTVPLAPRYDLRPRESRVRPLADAMTLFRFGRAARRERAAQRPSPPTQTAT